MIRRRSYSTRNQEEAQEFFATAYLGARWQAPADREAFKLVNQRVDAGPFQLDSMRMGATVASSFRPEDVYYVTYLSGGRLRVKHADVEEMVVPGELVLSGQVGVEAATEADDIRQEVITVRASVVREAAGLDPQGPEVPTFRSIRPLSAQKARNWRATQAYLHGILVSGETGDSPLLIDSASRLLASLMLETFPNSAVVSTGGQDPRDSRRPESLRRAVGFIEENAGRAIGITEIASAARVSPRAVELAFRRHLDTTPSAYLRRMRLDRAHHELLEASGGDSTSVAGVACRWGFSSPGRFSRYYRELFGTNPSETLRS
jgi:AraC-like DNA-binding protein